MTEKKTKKHVILGIPVLGSILLAIHAWFIYSFVFEGIGSLLDRLVGEGRFDSDNLMPTIGALFVLWLHRFWFRDEYKGSFRKDTGDKAFKICVLAYVIFDLAIMLYSFAGSEIHLPSLSLTLMAVMAGVCEETTFRALPISMAMRNVGTKRSIVIAAAVSSILFGLTHSINALVGGDMMGILAQVFRTTGKGLLYAAIYLRTGNMLIPIVMHVIHDYVAFFPYSGTNITVGAVSQSGTVIVIVYTMICIALGVFLLKGHDKDIAEVWKERWGKA